MDITPIALSEGKAYALDARTMHLDSATRTRDAPTGHLIISPYPTKYMYHWRLPDGPTFCLRPSDLKMSPWNTRCSRACRPRPSRNGSSAHQTDHTRDAHTLCNIRLREGDGPRRGNQGGRQEADDWYGKVDHGSLASKKASLRSSSMTPSRKGLGYKLVDTVIGIGHEKELKRYTDISFRQPNMLSMCRKLGCAIEPSKKGLPGKPQSCLNGYEDVARGRSSFPRFLVVAPQVPKSLGLDIVPREAPEGCTSIL